MTALPKARKAPRHTNIKLDQGILTVWAYPDGSLSLELNNVSFGITANLARDEAGDLIAALVPDTSALIETLDLLATAAEKHCPSPLMYDPEVVAGGRELRARIADARALLAEHAP